MIIGRAEVPISCSVRTLYRLFKRGQFDSTILPMKGKRKSNGHKEKRGKQAFKKLSINVTKSMIILKMNSVTLKVTLLLENIIKVLLLHLLNDYQK